MISSADYMYSIFFRLMQHHFFILNLQNSTLKIKFITFGIHNIHSNNDSVLYISDQNPMFNMTQNVF